MVTALLFIFCAFPVFADRAEDVRATVTYVASALSNGNALDALGPFDKSFKNYEKLTEYFQALTQGFEVTSEIELKDEDDADAETKLRVEWSLTLTDALSKTNIQRTAEINLTLALKGSKWKIVDLSPIEFFSPQQVRPR